MKIFCQSGQLERSEEQTILVKIVSVARMKPSFAHALGRRRTVWSGISIGPENLFWLCQPGEARLPPGGELGFGFRMRVTNCSIKSRGCSLSFLRIFSLGERNIQLRVLRGKTCRVGKRMDEMGGGGGEMTKARPWRGGPECETSKHPSSLL